MIDLNAKPPPKCKRCGAAKGRHQAGSMNCPASRHAFTYFLRNSVYEPRKTRTPPTQTRQGEKA